MDRPPRAARPPRREVGREPERRQARLPEDLVRVRPADTRERALVAKQRVELTPLAAEDVRERSVVEVERVRPSARARRRAAPASGATRRPVSFSRPRSGRARRRRRIAPGTSASPAPSCPADVAEPAGAHQVHAEDELAVGRREEKVLPAAPGPRERATVERRGRRVERLERRDVAGPRVPRSARVRRADRARRTHASTSGSSGMLQRTARGDRFRHRRWLRARPSRLAAVQPIVVEVTRGEVVEARHVVHAVAVRDGRSSSRRGSLSGHVPPVVREADAGAARGAGAARARRRGDRARLRVASRVAGAARGRAPHPRRRARGRGRARVRPGADRDRAQLLREARRLSRAVPREGLADARLPAARASVPAGDAARGRGGGRGGAVLTRRRTWTVAACRPSRCRSSAPRTPSRGSHRSREASASCARCARTPTPPWPVAAGRRS